MTACQFSVHLPSGATEFTTKPVNWVLLHHRLRYVLRAAEIVTELSTAQRLAGLGSWTWDAGSNVMTWSDGLYHLLGLTPQIPSSFDQFVAVTHVDDRDGLRRSFGAVLSGAPGKLHHRIVRADGEQRTMQHQSEARLDHHGAVVEVVGTLLDVTAREQDARKIHELAYVDPATELPNRRAFLEQLERAMSVARIRKQSLAVLYLDLDDFKRVNDTLGHKIGDLLLKSIAGRLLASVRSSDIVWPSAVDDGSQVARVGGDEFMVLLPGIRRGEDAATVSKRIVRSMIQPCLIDEQEVFITASIGIAIFPQDAADAQGLLKDANVAMYSAKRDGTNSYHFYDELMNTTAVQRLAMETHLRRALHREELSLHYQPQLDVRSQRVCGAEALLRWQSAELGSVPPIAFIPVAEESGLIVPIGEWVLRTACLQAQRWRDQGLARARIAVNISAVQFADKRFVAMVMDTLEQTGLAPQYLQLELTESVLMEDVDLAIEVLDAFKQAGIQVAIDDFGTGYSSLIYLKRLPIDLLKIDGSFVQDIISDPNDAAIVAAIAAMARSMELGVIAEGVETEPQLRMLERQGCHEVQGYFISRPAPADEFEAFVLSRLLVPNITRTEELEIRTVLFLDDDPLILQAVEARFGGQGYRVLTARTTDQAFEVLATDRVAVVVSDYRMDKMNGNEFLKRVRRLRPDATRIMLSGRSDMQSVIAAVNLGAIHRFVEKPICWETLEEVLLEGIQYHDHYSRQPLLAAGGRTGDDRTAR